MLQENRMNGLGTNKMSVEKKENKMEKQTATILSGKKPISSKPKVGPRFDDVDIFSDRYHVKESLRNKLHELGFEIRFVNKSLLDRVGGYHHRGWKVFKYKDFIDADGVDHLDFGLDGGHPDGVIQVAHDVLAVRPISMGDKHRADIKRRTQMQSGKHEQKSAEELREIANKRGTKVKVFEGYEENE